MVQRVLPISQEVGDLLSEVVREFVQIYKLGPESYDLWYHDEPIWIVRSTRETRQGVQVRRVQIAAFSTPEGDQLIFIPDAYDYDPKGKQILAKANAEVRRKSSQTFSWHLRQLVTDLPWKREELKRQLGLDLKKAWQAAQALPIAGK